VLVPTTTTLDVPTTSFYGQDVTFRAAVTPQEPADLTGGTVEFRNGAAVLGTGTLAPEGSQFVATFSTADLEVGDYNEVQAVYLGDHRGAASTSDVHTLAVSQAEAIITISPYHGTYDGSAHGIGGTARGVLGEDLSSLLDLGPTYVNAGS